MDAVVQRLLEQRHELIEREAGGEVLPEDAHVLRRHVHHHVHGCTR